MVYISVHLITIYDIMTNKVVNIGMFKEYMFWLTVYGWRQIIEIYDKEHRSKNWGSLTLHLILKAHNVSNAYGQYLHL